MIDKAKQARVHGELESLSERVSNRAYRNALYFDMLTEHGIDKVL